MNILFVCTGNTCRSPMAEGYLKSLCLKDINVRSCGLSAFLEPVSENSKEAMAEIGVDIKDHISRLITKEDIDWADKIICMSPSHCNALLPLAEEKLSVLGNGISDPYMSNINVYRNCRDEIITEIDKLFKPFLIAPIDRHHIKQIADLEKNCFSEPWSENALLDAFSSGTRFFVAEKNGKVLGYVGISCILDEGYITNIAVFPEYRNMGVGTALIEKTFSLAKEIDLQFVSLEVRESNFGAISLYEKLGFKQEGKRKNFYNLPKEDALIMTKRFNI